MVNKNIDSSARGLIILVIVAFIGVSIWCLCLHLDLNKLTSPAIDGSTAESRALSNINLDSLLASKGLKLECSSWSQKDVLAYNLTCEYKYDSMSAIISLTNVGFASCDYVNINGRHSSKILNISTQVSKENGSCLDYKIVPIPEKDERTVFYVS